MPSKLLEMYSSVPNDRKLQKITSGLSKFGNFEFQLQFFSICYFKLSQCGSYQFHTIFVNYAVFENATVTLVVFWVGVLENVVKKIVENVVTFYIRISRFLKQCIILRDLKFQLQNCSRCQKFETALH